MSDTEKLCNDLKAASEAYGPAFIERLKEATRTDNNPRTTPESIDRIQLHCTLKAFDSAVDRFGDMVENGLKPLERQAIAIMNDPNAPIDKKLAAAKAVVCYADILVPGNAHSPAEVQECGDAFRASGLPFPTAGGIGR